jgi:hypothetical protein
MGKLEGSVTPVRFGSEASGALTPLTSLSPMDLMPIPSPPVLTPHPPLYWENLASLCEDPFTSQTLIALQMSLREAQSPMYYE